jgi:hypothetical protein
MKRSGAAGRLASGREVFVRQNPWVAVAGLVLAASPQARAREEAPGETRARVSASVRRLIEPDYRQRTGLAFKSFDCPVGRPPGPGGGFLDCDAVDDEGDSLRYTLEVDEKGEAQVVLVSQPAAGMAAREKAALEPPCRAFLKSYAASDWNATQAALHPDLRQAVSREQAETLLAPMRRSLGAVRSATLRTFARRVPDALELEYALACEHGPGVARFRVDVAEKEARVAAFLVAPEPGSPLHAAMLQPALGDMVSGLVGKPVERLAAPLDRLSRVGDAVAATAYHPGGEETPIRIVQTGRPDDFKVLDYTAEVLDAPLLVRRYLAGRSQAVQSVVCPSRVVEDGGALTCRVVLDGSRGLAVTLARRGGEHRVTAERPID